MCPMSKKTDMPVPDRFPLPDSLAARRAAGYLKLKFLNIDLTDA